MSNPLQSLDITREGNTLDHHSIPPDIYKQMQRNLHAVFMSWYRSWEQERQESWRRFLFCLSVCRALDISWRAIGTAINLPRPEARGRYFDKIDPVREDIVAFANVQRRFDDVEGTLLGELKELHARVEAFDGQVFDQVRVIRQEGASWTTVGKCLGITRQAAQQRFSSPGRRSYRRVPTLVDGAHQGRSRILDSGGVEARMVPPVPRQGAQDENGTDGE